MSAPSTQDLIDALGRGILAVADGVQSYTLPDGRTVTRANLGEMIRAREALMSEAAAAGDGGGLYMRLGYGRPV